MELKRASSGSLEAPGWLWSSVVELIGVHERAYLHHCRRYALAEQKATEADLESDVSATATAD